MSDLQKLTDEFMWDAEFRKEYAKLQPEREITKVLLRARKEAGLTQAELSKKTGISQADISRLENGTRNPSLAILERIAEALDSTLRIEFVPNKPLWSIVKRKISALLGHHLRLVCPFCMLVCAKQTVVPMLPIMLRFPYTHLLFFHIEFFLLQITAFSPFFSLPRPSEPCVLDSVSRSQRLYVYLSSPSSNAIQTILRSWIP